MLQRHTDRTIIHFPQQMEIPQEAKPSSRLGNAHSLAIDRAELMPWGPSSTVPSYVQGEGRRRNHFVGYLPRNEWYSSHYPLGQTDGCTYDVNMSSSNQRYSGQVRVPPVLCSDIRTIRYQRSNTRAAKEVLSRRASKEVPSPLGKSPLAMPREVRSHYAIMIHNGPCSMVRSSVFNVDLLVESSVGHSFLASALPHVQRSLSLNNSILLLRPWSDFHTYFWDD